MFGKSKFAYTEQDLEVVRAEARTLEAERDRLLDDARELETYLSLTRRWLKAALDLAEERQEIIAAVEADLADARTALNVALRACADREERLAARS